MGILRFTDGENFDTSGPYRHEYRSDGWYLVGHGLLVAVNKTEEGFKLAEKLRPGCTEVIDGVTRFKPEIKEEK